MVCKYNAAEEEAVVEVEEVLMCLQTSFSSLVTETIFVFM